jgi:hypothetical protein
LPFSKWPPQYLKYSTLSDIIQILYVQYFLRSAVDKFMILGKKGERGERERERGERERERE